ncbi:hypothetical protein MKK58_07720 [Methylobacterium sp. J-078]|uniref:hypothetical protein n=1 Tax=Methylobacterium sp. J-078 TaxID=2836657 RepID=UPI001FBBD6B9|nr:hypothetical protein [Methylobacterium sp. J-078]MCJ2044421.1 hypothetical protein [Methylobacterium sp. J-078]
MTTQSKTAHTAEAAQSLRERAGHLRDAAGRFVRRKPAEPAQDAEDAPDAAASLELASMVAEWVRLTEVQDSGDLTDEEADAVSPEWSRLHGEICRFPARSLADLAAKAPLYRYERDDERASCKGEPTMPLRAWETVVQDIEALGALTTQTPGADPIFDMIDEARRQLREVDAAYAASADATDDDPRFKARNILHGELWAYIDKAILVTVPRTAAGCRELARFSVAFEESQGVPISDDPHAVTSLIARSPLRDVTTVRSVPAGDIDGTGLITYEDAGGQLHRRPIAQWIAFTAARLSSIAQSELTRQFNARYQGLSEEERAALEDELRRTLRIDALHDLAFRSDQVFEVHKGHAVGHRWRAIGDDAVKPDQPTLTPKASAEGINLSDLGINGLSALYERVGAVRELWNGAMCLPGAVARRHSNGCVTLSPLGRLADFEDSRLSFLRDRIVDEAARRSPANEYDRDNLLSLRIQHEIACNGRIDRRDAPDLLLEALKAWG